MTIFRASYSSVLCYVLCPQPEDVLSNYRLRLSNASQGFLITVYLGYSILCQGKIKGFGKCYCLPSSPAISFPRVTLAQLALVLRVTSSWNRQWTTMKLRAEVARAVLYLTTLNRNSCHAFVQVCWLFRGTPSSAYVAAVGMTRCHGFDIWFQTHVCLLSHCLRIHGTGPFLRR